MWQVKAESTRTESPEVRDGEQKWWNRDTALVVWIALGTVAAHLVTGWRYGFSRDELMALDDAQHMAWGYLQYPPMTVFFAWLAVKLFGTSLGLIRLFAALAQALALVLTGLMAKEMGGSRWAMVVAALAGVPFCLGGGTLLQYISFDYVCWVGVAYCVVRLVTGRQDSWWVGIGAGMGLGMLAKYTMGFLALGVVLGVLATPERKYLKSVWLSIGLLVAWLIFLPNLLWQWRHHFVSLEFFRFLHARDVALGLTDWFLLGQLELTMLAAPLALAGIWFCLFTEEGKRYRILGWMYLVPLLLFLVMRGRDYYLAPAYPMLYAAGAVWVEKRWSVASGEWPGKSTWWRRAMGAALAVDVVVAAALSLPIAPVGSRWWNFAAKVDLVFPDEIGWPEFVEGVVKVRDSLPPEERTRVGILVGNYGELGALNLYGRQYGLPRAISGVNSSWGRGYGDGADVLIVVGYPRELLEQEFASCVVGGRTRNQYDVANEETVEDPDIFVCRGLKESWPAFWLKLRKFA